MIVYRYLTREVYATLSVVTGVLVLIFLCNEFARYLSKAAAGKLGGAVVVKIIALQIPNLVGLLLPAGLFLGILLAYGRLYVDSEMTVLTACGFSRARLVAYTLKYSIVIMLLVALLTLYVTPRLMAHMSRLKVSSQADTLLQTTMPGRFQASPDGNQVYYIESISRDRKIARNVFFAQKATKKQDDGNLLKPQGEFWNITIAEVAHEWKDQKTGDEFVVAEDGMRYFGQAGARDFRTLKFEQYGMRLDTQLPAVRKPQTSMSNHRLWKMRKQDKHALPELQWRIVMPLSVPILAILAVPLSRVPPRRGRYAQLLPAVLIYTIYANAMFVARDWLEAGKISPWLGLWWLPALLLLVALVLLIDQHHWKRLRLCFARNRAAK